MSDPEQGEGDKKRRSGVGEEKSRGTGDLLRAKLKRRGRGLDMVTTHNKHNSLVNWPGHCVVSQILPHQPVDVVQNVKQIIFFWADIRTKYN